jgi:hypothetical protein
VAQARELQQLTAAKCSTASSCVAGLPLVCLLAVSLFSHIHLLPFSLKRLASGAIAAICVIRGCRRDVANLLPHPPKSSEGTGK